MTQALFIFLLRKYWVLEFCYDKANESKNKQILIKYLLEKYNTV
jgi:hypothetical protein